MGNNILLELEQLTTVFPTKRGEVRAVEGIDLTISQGEILGLVGESGCGKSTVLLSIQQLIRPPGRIDRGKVLFNGANLLDLSSNEMRNIRGKEIAMIFQDPLSTLNPAFPVGEQIRESLRLHHMLSARHLPWPFDQALKRQEKERVMAVMEEVGIPSSMERYATYPHQFSGGMQQRILIAIALVCEPALLLADEPTTALDVTIQAQIIELMTRINREHGTAIVLVTHDLGLAAEFCDRIAVMYAGRIIEQGTVNRVIENPQHPYTQGLLDCRPRISVDEQRLRPIPGNVPDLVRLPDACAFAPRCQFREQICETRPIPMVATGESHLSRCLKHLEYTSAESGGWDEVVRGK